MVATNIGNTSAKVIISDNATPSSGTYAWYIICEPVRMLWPKNYIPDGGESKTLNGISIGINAFILNIQFQIRNAPITSLTDWQNLLKALGTWEKSKTLLYLSIKNEMGGSTNLASFPTYATPTTLGQITGKVKNFEASFETNEIKINCVFDYTSS